MSGDLANLLKGSRSKVELACKKVEATFRDLTGGSCDASNALRYALSVQNHICIALLDNLQNGDLFSDIVGIMLPHLVPYEEKPSLWDSHLASLRYIHHGLCQQSHLKACIKLYNLIRGQPCRLQGESNFKIYLDIHLKHFNGVHLRLQDQNLPLEASTQLRYALESLGELFEAMRHKKITQMGTLLSQLNESLFGKRGRTFFKSLAQFQLLESLSQMLKPLLKLLASSDPSELANQFPEYLSLILALVQIDILGPQSSQQMSLQLLRMCKELFSQESNLNYALQLIYYYIKLIFVKEPAAADFKRTYMDLSRKFQVFFEHKGSAHAKEQWLTDLLVALQYLQVLIHQSCSKYASPFQFFWQQMQGEGSGEAYAEHFKLLKSCGALAVNVTRSPLGSNCKHEACKSLRRHCIMAYGLCALDAYNNWQPTQQQKADMSIHKPLLVVLRYTMDLATTMKCLGPTSVEIVKLGHQLLIAAHQVSCSEQMSLLVELLEPLQKLRPLIAEKEMQEILRRLYKASCHCQDPHMTSRLQASYLASLTNPSRLRAHLCLHYHNQLKLGKEIQKCVYEWHESTPLPHPLTPAQKKQLYDMDFFVAMDYLNGSSMAPLQSLVRCRKSDYHLVLLARRVRSDLAMLKQCQELRSKLKHKRSLSRMEHLSLGHANVGLLLDAMEAKKAKVANKEVNESFLEELLLRQNLAQINIKREQRLVELASEAITAFGHFFHQADQEPLGIEETPIDWQALIDDGVAAANGLSTMGYRTQADDAWLLLLRIGRLLEDRFTYLRALNHFLTQNEVQARLKLNLAEEVKWAEELLDDLWPQLHNGRFYKREQTMVMLCFCHLASYYARRDCLSHAQLLLLHVEQLRAEFPERLGKNDIILITMQTVRFRLRYQQRKPGMPRMMMPLRQLDTLMDNLRTFVGLSSLDNNSLMLLLNNLVTESTECSANRLSEQVQLSHVVLRSNLETGLALKTVEIFLSWLWTNLQMENFDKAQSKLRLIEHCLDIKPLARKETLALPEKKSVKDPAIVDLASHMDLLQLVEPIRKQQQLNAYSPKLPSMRSSSPNCQMNLNHYLNLDIAPPNIRENSQLKCLYFIMGCLHARLSFLQRNSEQLDEFYERAAQWLQENAETSTSLGCMLQVQQLYHVNYLRYRRKHVEAISTAQMGLKRQGLQAGDVNYACNFFAQLKTAQLELKPMGQEKTQNKVLRRALVFNPSPEDNSRNVAATASAVKDKATKINESHKKASKFKIYEELELRPPSAAGSSSGGGSGTENTPPASDHVDFNSCQLIEISDDDESPPPLLTKSSKSKAKGRAKTKATTGVCEVITLDNSLDTASTPSTRSTRSRRPLQQPEDNPTTASKSRRPRRQVSASQPKDTESTSTRRLNRH
ncbi:protein three rows isoform X1 [Drosophila gunungcola]|uniref:protein three rows isoform X1 n=1 Tax=Drosophila gunungcola TaxID=103775 RepID=UPI0022E85862|nr:protein three rows isoform X1 [Drosophila gunungcola]